MQETLSHYFGYKSFRPGQEEIITKILNHQHTLGVLPTGGGKSICYQVPGLMQGGTTIVISPLISLILAEKNLIKYSNWLNQLFHGIEHRMQLEMLK